MVQFTVDSITASDGTIVGTSHEGLLLFVGPNNAGKSRALRDIRGLAQRDDYVGLVITSETFTKHGEFWDVERVVPRLAEGRQVYDVPGWGAVGMNDINRSWLAVTHLGPLTDLFFLLADGTSRLTAGSSQQSFEVGIEPPSQPLHRIYLAVDLERELERMSHEAFGLHLMVDRLGGNKISLRLGSKPTADYVSGRPTQEFIEQLRAMVRLEDQGDGVRAYIGLLLLILAGGAEVLLIDEPEAFLHPPQARLLGRVLADQARGKQAFIATHSTDFLQGVLQSERPTTIVRVTRSGDTNHTAVLDENALKAFWSDSLLRHSNVLDGLFHDAVIVCESDSDCRYYSAVLHQLGKVEGAATRDLELLFTYSSTKSRMAVVARALKAVNVPVVVVADLDILRREPNDLKKLVGDMGGDYDEMSADHIAVASALDPVAPLLKLSLRDAFNDAIDAIDSSTIDDKAAEKLRKIIKGESGWDRVKQGGIAMVPAGTARGAADRLVNRLREIGILIVTVGELERFVPQVGGHGPRWVASVLEKELHKNSSEEAKTFVESIRDAAMSALQRTLKA